jgi:hypothetical protein
MDGLVTRAAVRPCGTIPADGLGLRFVDTNLYMRLQAQYMNLRYIFLLLFSLTCLLRLPAQNVIVTGAVVGNGSYATLGSAFWAISGYSNYGSHINVRVVGNTNESSTAFLSSSSASTLTITSGGGAVTGNVAGPLIQISNAARVFIQGLSMTNYSTSTASDVGTLRLSGNCNLMQITGCNIVGAGQSPTSGTVSIVSGGYGNGSILVESCNISSPPGATQANGVYVLGSPNNPNSNNYQIQIKRNSIRGSFLPDGNSHGIYIGPGNTDSEVFWNTITNTGNKTHTVGGRWCGILLDESGSFNGGNVIDRNTISGFSLIGAGPLSRLVPIVFSNGVTVRPAVVKNNVIESMSVSGPVSGVGADSPFIGMLLQGGSTTIGSNGSNRIGKTNVSANILINSSSSLPMDVYGIYCEGSGEAEVLDSEIGGITVSKTGAGAATLHGIRCATPSTVIRGNVVGYASAPLQLISSDSSSALVGISLISGGGDIKDNKVSYLKCNAPNEQSGGNASLIGIKLQAYGAAAIPQSNASNDTIFALSNLHLTAATSTIGVCVVGVPTRPVSVERLNIHSLNLSTNSSQSSLIGVYVDGGENIVSNSFVRLGMKENGTTVLNVGNLIGIQEIQGENSYSHNSVFLGGNNLSGPTTSANFESRSDDLPKILMNNIFYNARSNWTGSNPQYVVKLSGTSALTSDYNILYAPGSGAMLGKIGGVNIPNLGIWRFHTGLDGHSIERNPGFVNPMGNLSVGNLHLGPVSPAEGVGGIVAGVVQDFDGELRQGLTPVDIGADAGNFQAAGAIPAEIIVRGNGLVILDGDLTISALDGTAFDSIGTCTGPLEQVFWIENLGDDTLHIQSLTLSGSDTSLYHLSAMPGNQIPPNRLDSFAIRFTPIGQGNRHVIVQIQSNDADEAQFDFRVGGFIRPDTARPFLSCHDTSVTVPPMGNAVLNLSWVLDSAFDVCGIDTITLSQYLFSCADVGTNTVLVRALDAVGNVSTCTTTVNVSTVPFSMSVHADTTNCGFHFRCAMSTGGHGEVLVAGGCAPYQYAWSNGETTAQAIQLPAGMNYVTITDSYGSTMLDSVYLSAPPPLTINTLEMVGSCLHKTDGSLTVDAGGGMECGAYAWQWNTGDTGSRVVGLAPGIYSVTLTDVGGCQANADFEVARSSFPVPNLLQHRDTLSCTAPFVSYQWFFNGQSIAYMRDPWIVPDSSGSYSVEVTDSAGCSAVSNTLWMTSIQQIRQGHYLDNLLLSPNPAQGYVTLVAGDPVRTGVRVGFYDAAGRLIRKMERPDLEDRWTIDIHDLSAGIYFLNVSAQNGAFKVLRLVVQD